MSFVMSLAMQDHGEGPLQHDPARACGTSADLLQTFADLLIQPLLLLQSSHTVLGNAQSIPQPVTPPGQGIK